MSKKTIGALVCLLCASPAAYAQDYGPPKPERAVSLEAGVAHLAAKAAFPQTQPPSQQELLGILLFISLRGTKGRGA